MKFKVFTFLLLIGVINLLEAQETKISNKRNSIGSTISPNQSKTE